MTAPSLLLRQANRALTTAWSRGHGAPPTLDPARIEAYAAMKEGVDCVPGHHWREAFRLLLADLDGEARLSPVGQVIANGQLVKLLRARCRADRLFKRFPEIADIPVERPLIIIGPMRSGTTRVQRLLACDARFRFTRLFETLDPVPYRRGVGRRVAAAAAVSAFLRSANPLTHAIHPTGPRRPEEEFGHLSYAMHGAQFEVQWNIPNFARFGEQRDTRPVYADLRRLLQLNSWARLGDGGQSWLLKCPQYTADPASLLQTFPDARMLFLSRDPLAVVASSASLVTQQRRIHSDHVDPVEVGREWLAKAAWRARRTAKFRDTNPQVPQLDVSYAEVSGDWRAAMHRVYDFLGWELTPRVLRTMNRYLAAAKAHRGHHYSPEQFGLTAAQVEEAFAVEARSSETVDSIDEPART